MDTKTGTQVIELVDGYDRRHSKKVGARKLKFRNPANTAELVTHCDKAREIWFRSNDGTARQCKINGKIRTWKRNPERIEIPIKYGLYEYGIFTADDIGRVLIPIPEEPKYLSNICKVCGSPMIGSHYHE